MSLYESVATNPTLLDTNPLLKSLDSKNLVIFNDVIAPATHTDQSLKKVLTFSNNDDEAQIPWHKTMNLIDVFRLAGYYTTWLSNQETISIYGNAPETIARRSDRVIFSSFSDSYHSGYRFDEVLLGLLDNIRATNKHNKNLYVLHLIGTHMAYTLRYPKKYAKYTKEDITNLNESQSQKRAEYANAILYNDFVVSEIIKRFSGSDSIVFYFSDHGDEVYDFRDFSGHTMSMVSRFMLEIPFMVYMSDGFLTHYPHIAECVQKARNLPFMTDDFIHSLLDLIGIHTLDFDSKRSIFSDDFDSQRIRRVYGIDYDKEIKNIITAPQKVPS